MSENRKYICWKCMKKGIYKTRPLAPEETLGEKCSLCGKKELMTDVIEDEKEIKNDNLQKIIDCLLRKDFKQAYHLMAVYLTEKYDLFTFSDTKEIMLYQDGVYKQIGEMILSSEIQKTFNIDCSIHAVNEILAKVRRYSIVKRDNIQEPINKICLNNGILDLQTLKVIAHTSEIIFFNKIPVNYIQNADCPKISKFISEVVDEKSIPTLYEIAGYCLYKRYFIHKAIMLVGGGANGKSTYLNLLKYFLGVENIGSIPLQSLENNRFALAQLHGKLVNIFADLSSKALRDTSFFKMLVGEDLVPAEKKFKEGFKFLNYAKQIFSANQIPRSPEDTDAFFRRWIIVNFPNQFTDNADKNLLEKLTTPEELSGFLNLALEGLKRLLEKGEFSNSGTIEQIREQYVRMSDSVKAFSMDCVLINSDESVPKKEIYTNYCDYCRYRGYPIIAENIFHRNLQQEIRVEDYRPNLQIDGKGIRVQCWKGITVEISKIKNPDNLDHPDLDNVNPVNDVKVKSILNDDGETTNITYENVRNE